MGLADNPYDTKDNGHGDLTGLKGGLAIITGGASGIGFALAEASIAHGLHPVLVDIQDDNLTAAATKLEASAEAADVTVSVCQTDVSSLESVEAMAKTVREQNPDKPIALLCCNAGVGSGGGVLTGSNRDWDFVFAVNVMGVLHCVRTIVPLMLEDGSPGSVMATSSQDGLCAGQNVYGVTKQACIAIMEGVHQELQGRLTSHVLCPQVTATNIVGSERYRPDRFGGPSQLHPRAQAAMDMFKNSGVNPAEVANNVFNAMESGTFYIMSEAEQDPGYIQLQVETRMNSILNGERPYRPRSPWHSEIFAPPKARN